MIKHTGDGYFAAFQGPAAGIEAAASIQRALDEHEPLAPDVRIGLHTGGALHKADGDYSGQGVHMAARIGALAGGGEILVSRESLDGGTRFRLSEPLGAAQGLRGPRRARRGRVALTEASGVTGTLLAGPGDRWRLHH